MKLPRLSLIASNGLKRLEARGVVPDWEDVAALHTLGLQLENPGDSFGLSVLGDPVKVGNVVLWPWSIGAARWYKRKASEWFNDNPELDLCALAFSFVNARRPEVLSVLVNREDAVKSISAWIETCGATLEELSAAIDRLLPHEDEPKTVKRCPECHSIVKAPEEEEADIAPRNTDEATADLLALLLKNFPGTTVDFWTWGAAESLAVRFLYRFMRNTVLDGGAADSRNPQMMATHRFETALRMITAKHEARKLRASAPQTPEGKAANG